MLVLNDFLTEAFIGDKVKAVVDDWKSKNPKVVMSIKRASNKHKSIAFLRWFYDFMAISMYVKALDALGSLVLSALAEEKGKELKAAGILSVKQGILIGLTLAFPGLNGSWVVQGLGWALKKMRILSDAKYKAVMNFLELSSQKPDKEMADLWSFDEFKKKRRLVRIKRDENSLNDILQDIEDEEEPDGDGPGGGRVIQGKFTAKYKGGISAPKTSPASPGGAKVVQARFGRSNQGESPLRAAGFNFMAAFCESGTEDREAVEDSIMAELAEYQVGSGLAYMRRKMKQRRPFKFKSMSAHKAAMKRWRKYGARIIKGIIKSKRSGKGRTLSRALSRYLKDRSKRRPLAASCTDVFASLLETPEAARMSTFSADVANSLSMTM